MITRTVENYTRSIARKYPVTTIIGPRQSGKTTLAKAAFSDLEYVNLEKPTTRAYAAQDPEAFLRDVTSTTGVILDEVQRVPALLSYIQVAVDEKGTNRQFILTGSNQLSVRNGVSQSLAGRTALIKLLPFSLDEVAHYGDMPADTLLLRGMYPRIHENDIPPAQAYGDYFETYIERDLRQLINVKNIALFERFMRLCAGRTGQLLNLDSLANDVGVTRSTIRQWLTALEESFIVFELQPLHANIRKRLVKASKLYFCDTGLACWLLGIETSTQLRTHPLRGSLYENLVICDVLKYRYNTGASNNLCFYRDRTGNEVDLVYRLADTVVPVEIKAAQTLSSGFFREFDAFFSAYGTTRHALLVYNGNETQTRQHITALNEKDVVHYLARLSESA